MTEQTGPEVEADVASNTEPEVGPAPEPEQAWKALGLVNDWIKHAEAKVGATLAASGAVGVALYNLVKNEVNAGLWLSVFAVACAVMTIAAGGSATLALMPRLRIVGRRKVKRNSNSNQVQVSEENSPPEDPVNLLFFANIARHYKDDSPSYVEVLRSMTADPEKLTRQIAHQVHANASVAHRKYAWADRAIKCLAAALVFLAAVAIIIGSKG